MASKMKQMEIPRLDITKKELTIFVGILAIVGAIIVTISWYRSGSILFPSQILLVETGGQTSAVPTIKNVSIKNVTGSEASISWSLSVDTPTVVQYGFREDNLVYETPVRKNTQVLTLTSLFPKTRYFFRIVAGPSSSPIISETYSFITTK